MTDVCFLKSGCFQDGLKLLVYFIPLVYIFVKKRDLKLKFFALFCLGLFLLFSSNLLDFLDEFRALDNLPVIGHGHPMQDFFEDTIGSMLGFIILVVAMRLELKKRKG